MQQSRYSQLKATSLRGTMLAFLSLLFCPPPADTLPVKASPGRSPIYVSVLKADMQTPVPPLLACRASHPSWAEGVRAGIAAGEASINPQVPGAARLSVPSAPHSALRLSLRSSNIKEKHLDGEPELQTVELTSTKL